MTGKQFHSDLRNCCNATPQQTEHKIKICETEHGYVYMKKEEPTNLVSPDFWNILKGGQV